MWSARILLIPCTVSVFMGVSGCMSHGGHDLRVSDELATVSFDLYLTRRATGGEEFERYRALPSGVFVECGTLARGRAVVQEQAVDESSGELLAQSRALAREVSRVVSEGSVAVDKPVADGDRYDLRVQINGREERLVTAMDYVTRKQTPIAAQSHALLTLLRVMVARPLCGRARFVG